MVDLEPALVRDLGRQSEGRDDAQSADRRGKDTNQTDALCRVVVRRDDDLVVLDALAPEGDEPRAQGRDVLDVAGEREARLRVVGASAARGGLRISSAARAARGRRTLRGSPSDGCGP